MKPPLYIQSSPRSFPRCGSPLSFETPPSRFWRQVCKTQVCGDCLASHYLSRYLHDHTLPSVKFFFLSCFQKFAVFNAISAHRRQAKRGEGVRCGVGAAPQQNSRVSRGARPREEATRLPVPDLAQGSTQERTGTLYSPPLAQG